MTVPATLLSERLVKQADQLRPGLPQEVALNSDMGGSKCRAKVAPSKGLWSAFWALGNNIEEAPWPGCGEIDILENIGAQPNRVFGTVHVPGASKESGLSGGVYLHHSPADGFHIFSVDWEPDRLTWQVDGRPYHSLTRAGSGKKWIFDHPFYLMLNLAVGGWLGGELDPRALPADFVVDFIRWYDLPRSGILESPPRARPSCLAAPYPVVQVDPQ